MQLTVKWVVIYPINVGVREDIFRGIGCQSLFLLLLGFYLCWLGVLVDCDVKTSIVIVFGSWKLYKSLAHKIWSSLLWDVSLNVPQLLLFLLPTEPCIRPKFFSFMLHPFYHMEQHILLGNSLEIRKPSRSFKPGKPKQETFIIFFKVITLTTFISKCRVFKIDLITESRQIYRIKVYWLDRWLNYIICWSKIDSKGFHFLVKRKMLSIL